MAVSSFLVESAAPIAASCGSRVADLVTEPEIANNALNLIAIGLTLYVTSITRRLDRKENHGGE